MKKFNQFYLEKLFESVLESSPEFFELIGSLPSGDKVSDYIHRWIDDNTDITTKYNYLNVDPKNSDKVLFIPDNQFQRAKSQGQDAYNKTKSDSALGRFARALMKDNNIPITDPEIENFVNAYKKEWLDRYTEPNFRIVKGDDILHWYLQENYYKGGLSTLGNSCMRYKEKNHFMKLYSENSDVVSMAIMTKLDDDGEEKLVSRGLIWKIDDNKYYSDRIYYNSNPLYPLMKKLISQELDGEIIFYEKGNIPPIKVNLKNIDFEKYPYADSLYYIFSKLVDGRLSDQSFIASSSYFNDKYEDLKDKLATFKIQDTSGYKELLNATQLSKYEDKIFLNSEIISYGGDYFPISDSHFSKYSNIHIPKKYAIFSEYLNDWIRKDRHVIHSEFGIIPEDLFINVITKYIGDKSYPWDIYDDISSNLQQVVEMKMLPKQSNNNRKIYYYSSYYSDFNRIDVQWLNKFKTTTEFASFDSVSLFNVKVVKLDDINNVPREFLFKDNWMLKVDAKMLGVPDSSIEKESTSSIHLIDGFKKLNYKKTSELISSNRNLTTREKKWRKSFLDWFDKRYEDNTIYKAYNSVENFEETIKKFMEIHKKWHYKNFVSDRNWDSFQYYVDYKMVQEVVSRSEWSETPHEIKDVFYEYIPKIQFIWIYDRNTAYARDTLRQTLYNHNRTEYDRFQNFSMGTYETLWGALRDFLYYFEDNSRSEYISELRKEFPDEVVDSIHSIITSMTRENDFPQILEY